jgi:hypothetical protein
MMRFWFFLFCFVASLSVALAEEAPLAKARTASFNPDISLILSGGYAQLSNDPDHYALPGFMLGAETGPGTRGLSLAESELVMSANVDDLFYGYFMASIAPDNSISVEEAAVETRGLAEGVTLRVGRFYSGIGYLNTQHPHAWDFADIPLAYRAFLANRYADDGVQLRWVAPADVFVEFGAEWFRGQNYPAGGAANNGQGAASAFVHVGGDVGDSHAWRSGLSYLRAQALGRESGAIDTAPDAFSGDSNVAIADFVWKWSPHGNATQTNFKLQAEYLWRKEDGSFTADVNGILGPAVSDAYRATQSGWYLQTVYQFMPQWRAGLRYDQLRPGDIQAGANAALFDTGGHTPRRASVMLDWSHSEFSRVRLQLSSDHSQPDTDSQVFVQYIMSLGAHGAHSF